jgi:hypothetical protein
MPSTASCWMRLSTGAGAARASTRPSPLPPLLLAPPPPADGPAAAAASSRICCRMELSACRGVCGGGAATRRRGRKTRGQHVGDAVSLPHTDTHRRRRCFSGHTRRQQHSAHHPGPCCWHPAWRKSATARGWSARLTKTRRRATHSWRGSLHLQG